MLGNATITAFLATADAPRAKRFYENVLGLKVKSRRSAGAWPVPALLRWHSRRVV